MAASHIPLIAGVAVETLPADRGYGTDIFIAYAFGTGMKVVQAPWLSLQTVQCRREVSVLTENTIVLIHKSEVTKVLVQETAARITSISRSAETYRTEMERLASMLPEYQVVMEIHGVGKFFGRQLMAQIG